MRQHENKGRAWLCRAMWRGVGTGDTEYHPINSSEGKTCLSTTWRQRQCGEAREQFRTLVAAGDKKLVIDARFAIFLGLGDDRELEGVDDLDFTAVLRAEQRAEHCALC